MSVNAEHTNRIKTKRHHSNIYSPLYSPKIGRSLHRHFHERTWGRLPEAIEFQSENSPISTSFPTSNAKPSFTFEAELGAGTCLQSSAICHSSSFSRFKEMNNFKFFTRAKFHKTKSAPDGQNCTVNSTCQLKSPFDRFSRCHINLLEYHSQHNEQLGTVMSNDNLLFFWLPKLNKILNRATAKTMSDSATQALHAMGGAYCLLSGDRVDWFRVLKENLEKNVYNLDGESRRSRLGSCFFYDSLDWACYNSHGIAMIHVIFLVASLESEHLQVYLQVRSPAFPTALRYIGDHCSGRRSGQKKSLRKPLAASLEIYLFLQSVRTKNEWHIVGDCRHVPLSNSASNEKFGFALDVGSEVEIGLFSRWDLVASRSRPQVLSRKCRCKSL